MTIINVSGVDVDFPYEPYELQKDYMRSVIRCLQQGSNGLLESPTGTGKTLCLLCATLAWREVKIAQIQSDRILGNAGVNSQFQQNLKENLSNAAGVDWIGTSLGKPLKVIYTSRTHSQLSQVVQELKRTKYSYLRTCILGSRQQMCIHPEVMKETNASAKVHLCHNKIKNSSCYFYTNLKNTAAGANKMTQPNPIMDIEDLVTEGKKEKLCPYFWTRGMVENADIIFMPYNYLFDEKFRSNLQIPLQGNIVIFDEGHNLEKVCEETASCELRQRDLAACIDEVDYVLKKIINEDTMTQELDSSVDFSVNDLALLKAMFCELEDYIGKIKVPADGVFQGDFMYSMFETVGLTLEKSINAENLLTKVIEYMTSFSEQGLFQKRGTGLSSFLDVMKTMYRLAVSTTNRSFTSSTSRFGIATKYFKVFVKDEQLKPTKLDVWKSNKSIRSVNFWCFSPGMSMKDLQAQEPHTLIVTSGTLCPLQRCVDDFQIRFPVLLENPHVIEDFQVFAGVVSVGPDGVTLNSKFDNRTAAYFDSLGKTILNIIRIIPGGVLVFFPSYSIMRLCCERWEATAAWMKFGDIKMTLVEPATKEEFNETMHKYYEAIKDPARKGALLFGVCRGKVSEGIDFTDMNGRAVIITGIPFAAVKEPRVMLKRTYQDGENKTNKQALSGSEWYMLDAIRAVNQAIGRVIRHKDDYGAILLCDERFNSQGLKQKMSSWLNKRIGNYQSFGKLMGNLAVFYRTAKQKLPVQGEITTVPFVPDFESTLVAAVPRVKIEYEPDTKPHNLRWANSNASNSHASSADVAETDVSKVYSSVKSANKAVASSTNENAGVLDLLGAHVRTQFSFNFNEATTSVSRTPTSSGCSNAPRKKRKIVIKPNEKSNSDLVPTQTNVNTQVVKELSNAGENLTTSSQEPKPSNDGNSATSKAEMYRNYLRKIKKELNAEQYASVTAALKQYGTKQIYCDLKNLLKLVFSKRPDLLKESRVFLLSDHKTLFDKEFS